MSVTSLKQRAWQLSSQSARVQPVRLSAQSMSKSFVPRVDPPCDTPSTPLSAWTCRLKSECGHWPAAGCPCEDRFWRKQPRMARRRRAHSRVQQALEAEGQLVSPERHRREMPSYMPVLETQMGVRGTDRPGSGDPLGPGLRGVGPSAPCARRLQLGGGRTGQVRLWASAQARLCQLRVAARLASSPGGLTCVRLCCSERVSCYHHHRDLRGPW